MNKVIPYSNKGHKQNEGDVIKKIIMWKGNAIIKLGGQECDAYGFIQKPLDERIKWI